MQINKKLTTMSITALLLLSMIAFAVPALAAPGYAIQVDSTTPNTGPVGTKVTIVGSAASAGGTIQVYWENLAGSLLNTTSADGLGAFSVTAVIPDTTAGPHFLIILDASTGTTIGTLFTVTPKITVSPARAIPGDIITVTGTGFNGTSTSQARNVTITLTNATLGGTTLYTQVVAAVNATSTGNFSVTFAVPAVDYGNYIVNASDQSRPTVNFAQADFVVGAAITISPASGPSGTIVTMTGRGFTKTANTNVTVAIGSTGPVKQVAQIKTLADGTFTGQFIVPTLAAANYSLTATDGTVDGIGTLASANGFKVTKATGIIVNPTSAAPGGSVTLTGFGFTAIAGTTVNVAFGVTAAGTFAVASFTTDVNGNFTGTVAVPNLPTQGYFFNATDANALNATTPFTIAITALFTSPVSGPTGTIVTITAFGLTGTTANVTLGTARVLTNVAVSTLAAGTATFIVPTITTGAKTVTVVDNNLLTASTTFTVTATSTLVVGPSTAPANVDGVTLTVSNFAQGLSVNFFIVNATNSFALTTSPAAPVVNASLIATATFTVPALALGTYTIVANETSGLFNATAAFTIGEATLNISPRATTYNQGDIASFKIQSTFATSFAINVFDPEGTPITIAIQSGTFVLSGGLYVYPYSTGQMWGYTVGSDFVIPNDAVLGTWTWNATTLGTTKSGNFTVQKLSAAVNLTDVTTRLDALNTTLFGVGANVTSIKGTVATIQTATGQIQANLSAINATVIAINGNTATLSTTLGTVTSSINSMQQAVSGLSGTVTSISSGVATIQTTLGTVQTSIGSINSAIVSVAEGQATIQTTLGTITTSLTAINTIVTRIDGNVATVQTDLGTLTGTVTSVKDGVATIQTNLGTMQASIGTLQTDVADVQTDVTSTKDNTASLSPLIIVAIVLALVAAIAAIASIVLMRRKIAG
jgi:trimeric autotransporter adhesin